MLICYNNLFISFFSYSEKADEKANYWRSIRDEIKIKLETEETLNGYGTNKVSIVK